MKRTALLLPLLFLIPALAQAAALMLQPVGEYGGIRVRIPCRLEVDWRNCAVDTGGPVTMTAPSLLTKYYQILERVKMSSIGLDVTCDRVLVPDADFAGNRGRQDVLRCPGFFESISPTIGMDSFAAKSFSFDFDKAEFNWLSEPVASTKQLRRERHWMVMPARVGGISVEVGFDTGAPVTLVDQKFVDAYPGLFVRSSIPPSEMLQRRHLVAYELRAPILVGGAMLNAKIVHVGDFSPLGISFPIILGANHMASHRWDFDLARNIWNVDGN